MRFPSVRPLFAAACSCFSLLAASPCLAESDVHRQAMEIGKHLGGLGVLPFACMLLSIAVMPLAAPRLWHRHFGKIALFWALAYLAPFCVLHGFGLGFYQMAHTLLLEYVPFIILLLSLFTITGGVCLSGSLVGRPGVNTAILLAGTLLASWMGTTGAAMLLIRPLLRAVAHRRYKVHTVVFFIFLVANVGGCLTPLGDPPLCLGFLEGVSCFWTTTHLLPPLLRVGGVLLTAYFLLDTVLYNREGRPAATSEHVGRLRLLGARNLLLLLGVVGAVLLSGTWNPGVEFTLFHVHLELQNIARDVALLALAGYSLWSTPEDIHRRNEFDWAPMAEVAKLFAGIFLSMIPAIAILRAGEHGALSGLIALVTHGGTPDPTMYFWLSGALSSFLDNAPTYLVFFNTAGGDAQPLMDQVQVLLAISAGSVFMGANSYIGNAPNFMVRSVAESAGVRMPSFFGYMIWSTGILVPCFILTTLVFFR